MKDIFFTVIIPNYNNASYLDKSLKSISFSSQISFIIS